jgi:hypothetical protein
MFSRSSSLLAYVVVGLAISAAATPMGPSREGRDYDDGSKSPSYPDSTSYSSPAPTNYLADDSRPKPYAAEARPEEKKSLEETQPEEKYPKEKQAEEKAYPKDDGKDKPYPKDDDKDKSYPKDGDKDKPYPKADDKDKPHGDLPKGQYPSQKSRDGKPDDKDKSSYSGGPKYGDQCNVGKQECCNGYNEVNRHRASRPQIRC